MATDPIPWMVQGGLHNSNLGRIVAYQATGGSEGIAGLGDLLVTQQTVAAGSVQIAAGAAIMVNRYPGVRNESYVARNPSSTNVAVAQNSSGSTRYDLVVARIDDWNFPGAQAVPGTLPTSTADGFKLAVISGVSAATKTAAQLGLNYPAVALARIAIPAATAAITKAMITDLREMAVPRRLRSLNTKALTTGQEDTLDATGAGGELWPNVASWVVEVPPWATRVRCVARWDGIKVPASCNRNGTLWIRLGNGHPNVYTSQTVGWDGMGVGNASRQSLGCSDDLAVPSTMRGQSITYQLWGRISGGSGAVYFTADAVSSLVLDMEFLEAPTEDV